MFGYENMCSFQNLYNAHLAARKGKRDKSEVIRFEMNLAENLCKLQQFALLYLDEADRLIKEKLRIKYYVRYMDDFILLHHSKEYLHEVLSYIRELFEKSLLLTFNEKTQIFPVKNGVRYLGWRFYLTKTGKVVRILQTEGKRRTKRRFVKLKCDYTVGIASFSDVKRSLVSTHGHLMHGHTFRLRNKLWGRLVFNPHP